MNPPTIRLALVGLGKIARDQHVPALAADPAFRLAATVDPAGGIAGVPHFPSLEAMLASGAEIDAAAICTSPQLRHGLADTALSSGLHVLLEKPPAASLSEVAALEARAAVAGRTLFAAWHSRFAAGVAPARAWLRDRRVTGMSIDWREDVRVWHPGQAWIFRAGGMGVFDPGINALSIATAILPHPVHLVAAELDVPENREAPIAARLALADSEGTRMSVVLDFRQTGPQTWDIAVETEDGPLLLQQGGAVLTLPEGPRRGTASEYAGVYARFAELIHGGACDVDSEPLRLVADAFLRGTVRRVEAFED